MPPLFNDNQKLDESELVDYLAKKAPRSHKAMMILQVFNTETGYLATIVEHCKQADTTNKISIAKFYASDKDIDTKKNKKLSKKTKEREDNGKKRRKNSSLYSIFHGEKNSHNSRECKVLKSRDLDKYKSKYVNKCYKNSFKELNLLQAESAHQKSNYENLNKAFTKKKTSKEDIVVLADSSDSDSSSRSESNIFSPETGKSSIAYDSDSTHNYNICSSSISSEDNN